MKILILYGSNQINQYYIKSTVICKYLSKYISNINNTHIFKMGSAKFLFKFVKNCLSFTMFD